MGMAVGQDASRRIEALTTRSTFCLRRKSNSRWTIRSQSRSWRRFVTSLGRVAPRMGRFGYSNWNRHCEFAPVKPVRTPFNDDLGASRAGKPANSPVGAISQRRGSLNRTRAVFYTTRPARDAPGVYTPGDLNTPCCVAAILF